ncbi:hypothetical protein [Bacillus weihaiensis]|nr:hypothetical protein [Bacillus weihaiensis]
MTMVEKRFDKIDQWMVEMDQKSDKVNLQLTGVSKEVSGVKERVSRLDGKVDNFASECRSHFIKMEAKV